MNDNDHRALGAFEHLFWIWDQHRPNHFVLVAEIEGQTEIPQWRSALDALQARHPLLSARIEVDSGGKTRFAQADGRQIPIRVESLDATTWEAEAAHELGQRFDTGQGPLCRTVLLHEQQRATILFVAHHALLDGRGVSQLLSELLRIMAGEVLPRLATVPPPEAVFEAELRNISLPEMSEGTRDSGFRTLSNTLPNVEGMTMPVAATKALVHRCREEGTTVHGAIGAAIIGAGRTLNEEWSRFPIRIATPVNIRALSDSFEEAVGVYFTPARVQDEHPSGTDFWDIARSIKQGNMPYESRAGKMAGLKFLKQLADTRPSVEVGAQLLSNLLRWDLLLTNLGRLGIMTNFGKLRLNAVWGPMVNSGFSREQVIGVATHNGCLRVAYTSYEPIPELMATAANLLMAE